MRWCILGFAIRINSSPKILSNWKSTINALWSLTLKKKGAMLDVHRARLGVNYTVSIWNLLVINVFGGFSDINKLVISIKPTDFKSLAILPHCIFSFTSKLKIISNPCCIEAWI